MSDSELEEQQTIVHQKLGRFLLRVQHYEKLLKALVVDSFSYGTSETVVVNQQKRIEMFSTKPMGYLFDEINRTYLRELGQPDPEEDGEPLGDPKKVVFRTRLSLAMPADQLERTKSRLDAFKNLRNRIVHHFLDDHDLGTQEGCERAIASLEEGLALSKANYEEIQQWAKSSMEAAKYLAELVKSRQFDDFCDGIMPDGTVDWPNSTAVALLRHQEKETAPGEMTRLDLALEAMRATHPNHQPHRYFCQSWREVLKKSGLFRIRREKGTGELKGVTWYRSLDAVELKGQ